MIYEYSMLAPVVFGVGAAEKTGEKIKEMGLKRALCMCDEGVKNAGILDKIVKILEDAGIEAVIFDRVLPEPPDTMIDEAGAFVRECGADCIVGIGGGSSLDAAKMTSILYSRPGSIVDCMNFEGPPFFIEGGLPTILLPTTAGTGSEVSPICVVTHTQSNTKMIIFSGVTLAIVDPELCRTAPKTVTAFCGLDALAHNVEAITAKGRNPFSEAMALASAKLIAEYLPAACRDGNDMEARGKLSLAANFSGLAFPLTNVHVGHAAADSISASYHTPHGLNCAWVTPAVIEVCALTVPDKVKLIGEALGVVFTGNETDEETGRMTGDAARALMKECGVPTFEEKGFDRDTILSGVDYIVSNVIVPNCPTDIDAEKAEWLLARTYDGYK